LKKVCSSKKTSNFSSAFRWLIFFTLVDLLQ
jgi:hypothetical protein